jgi:hypothetical protein
MGLNFFIESLNDAGANDNAEFEDRRATVEVSMQDVIHVGCFDYTTIGRSIATENTVTHQH